MGMVKVEGYRQERIWMRVKGGDRGMVMEKIEMYGQK